MEKLIIAGREFNSRLFLGTGKFNSNEIMEQSILASGTEMVTVAMKRIELDNEEDDMLKHIRHPHIQLLPNTSGVRTAEEAVFAAQMAREAFGTNWLKLEIHPDPRYLLPDSTETLKATEELVKLDDKDFLRLHVIRCNVGMFPISRIQGNFPVIPQHEIRALRNGKGFIFFSTIRFDSVIQISRFIQRFPIDVYFSSDKRNRLPRKSDHTFDHGFIFIFLIKHDNIAALWFFFLICMTVSDEPVMNHQCRFHTLRWHPPDHQKTTECDNNGKKNCYVNHPPHDIFSFLFCLFVHRFLPVCFSFGINHIIPEAKMYKFF